MSIRANETTPVWPNFFIVGAAKCGTTSLYAGLRLHPGVFMCYPKEPHFFTQVTPPRELRWHFDTTIDEPGYLRLFERGRGFQAVGEASTSYLWHPRVPARIRRQAPDARIIISLRDPVERAYSHYLMHVREGIQTLPFYDALQQDLSRSEPSWGVSHMYVEKGRYAAQVERYLETFGPERVKIVLLDDFRRNPRATLLGLARFLGLDPAPVARIDVATIHNPHKAPRGRWAERLAGSMLARVLGETVVPRRLGLFVYQHMLLRSAAKPAMDQRARDFLLETYQSEIDDLERILGRSMPELRRSWPAEQKPDRRIFRLRAGR